MPLSPIATANEWAHRAAALVLMALLVTSSPGANATPPPKPDNRVIIHSQGETRISGTPKRVVTLFQGANDTAVALGVTPVGVVDAWAQGAHYDYLDKALDGVSSVGLETQPSLEAIALLEPDLIIASRRRHEAIYPQLAQIAPTVSLATVFDVPRTLEIMGQALNREDKANALWVDWQARLKDFRQQAERTLGNRWPLSATVLNFRADHTRLYLGGSYAGSVLKDLGFTQPPAHPKNLWMMKLTTKESIPIIDADVVFYFMEDDPSVRDSFDAWTRHPLWQNLDAARNQQVYPVDRVAWNLAGGILGANRMLDQLFEHFELEDGS